MKNKQLSMTNVKLNDNFLKPYYRLVCDAIVPYQWETLNDRVEGAEKSHCVENIRIAAGLSEGEFYGFLFQDSDLAKWLETVAYCVQNGDATEFEAHMDDVIDLIEKAQEPDGYFNTYFQVMAPERKFANLHEAHELYCLGHLLEAAIAYEQATGKRKLLDITLKFVDLVDSKFGSEDDKRKGYPGHQEIEIALARLYEATNDEKYLKLGKYFIDERGQEPNYFVQEWNERKGFSEWTRRVEKHMPDFSYNQAHKPVREQTEAVGHAVRALYMYAAMADIGRLANDGSLLDACRRIFEDVSRQMYVTGGVGSTHHGEAFTFEYDLPNDVNYSETCASIALVFFMHNMLKAEKKGVYADVMERALYNTVLAGVALDGQNYFYVNPMEVVPKASEKTPDRRHVKAQRQKWHACACCPPNFARLLASIGKYLYSCEDDSVFVHLYAASQAEFNLSGGMFSFKMQTEYPLDGKVSIVIEKAVPMATLALRIPGWIEDMEKHFQLKLNGKPFDSAVIKDGYAYISREFLNGDTIEFNIAMPPQVVYANNKIRADAGKVCIQRGPLVYCLEECDNGAGLHSLLLDSNSKIKEQEDIIGGIRCITLTVNGLRESSSSSEMYSYKAKELGKEKLKFAPYHLWGNRAPGEEMIVWVREA